MMDTNAAQGDFSVQEKEALAWLKDRSSRAKGLLWASAFAGIGASLFFVLQSFILADFLSNLALAEKTPTLISICFLLPVFILRSILLSAGDLAGTKAAIFLKKGIREALLEKIVSLGPNRVHIAEDGVLSSMVLEEVDAMDDYFARYFPQKILAVATPVLIIAAVFPYSALVALLLFLTAPLVPFFMFLIGKEAASAGRRQFTALAGLSGKIREILRGLHVLRQLNATDSARKHLERAADSYRKRTLSVLRLAFLSSAVLELFASVSIALVAVYLGMGLLKMVPWARGETPVALFPALFILLLIPEFYAALRRFGSDYHARAMAVAAVISLEPLLKQEILPPQGKKVWKDEGAPEIMVKNLFWQPLGRQPVLRDIHLHLAPGERIGLAGPSGAGKSSILNLLLGFDRPSSGEILLNGKNIFDFDPDTFRRHIAFFGQRADWFSLSIRENLLLGKGEASDEDLYEALDAAGMGAFVKALPQGLDTLIGEGGQGFSGGQLHRLALARVLLQEASLWILDEPGAHLDSKTAMEVRRRIGELSCGKTLIMAGHKFTGMEWLDRLVVLEDGEIRGEGPFPAANIEEGGGR